MKTRKELKQLAKEQIKGKIGILFLITLIIGLLGMAISAIPVVGTIASLIITPALEFSAVLVYWNMSKDPEYQPAVGDVFKGFSNFANAFRVYFANAIFTFLWMLLFYIPGIVKAIAYSQCFFILADNPEMTGREAIKKSSEMMKGHKWEYFVLCLSFAGWAFLAVFTFGLLYIWLVPYTQLPK